MAKLSEGHVNNVCKVAQGSATCSYLVLGGDGFECMKNTDFKQAIDEMRSDGSCIAM